jgi:hypothetical protein
MPVQDNISYRRVMTNHEFYNYIKRLHPLHNNIKGDTPQQIIDNFQQSNALRWKKIRQNIVPGIDPGPCCWTYDDNKQRWIWQ